MATTRKSRAKPSADTAQPSGPSMIERIERALLVLAYFIELDGDVHVAMYETFEAELHQLRHREDTKARARRLLADYSRAGGAKAISSRNLSLNVLDQRGRPSVA